MTTEPLISDPDVLPYARVQLIRDRLTVTELNDVTVSHPHCFLSANGTYIVDEAFFPRFASNVREATPDMMASFEALPERRITGRCLVFQNWGVGIWGHFLIFMLPRLALARCHGIDLAQMPILMSVQTPAWQYAALRALFGLSDESFVTFNPRKERVRIDHAVIPEIPYRLDGFRPGAHEIFEEFRDQGLCAVESSAQPSNAVVLIDRRPYLDKSASYKREARNFESLEAELRKHAPDLLVIDPAHLSITEQVELFWNASMVVGEYGSALHNTVFGRAGQVVISIGKINPLQSHICKLMGQDYIAIDAPCLDAEFDIPITEVALHFKDYIGRLRSDHSASEKK
jgi:capsular polysaccharide biosynthesis protein